MPSSRGYSWPGDQTHVSCGSCTADRFLLLSHWETHDKSRQHMKFKKQRHHFADKCLNSQSYGFSSSHVWMWELDIKKAEHWRIDTCELWCWRRVLRVPWTARRSNQSILKEINTEYSFDGLMLKLKPQYFGYLMWRVTWCPEPTHWKRHWCWERLKAKGEGVAEDEMVR